MSSLRASATIIVLRVLARPSAVRAANHWARALFFWNLTKRQASWIMPLRTRTLPARKTPFASTAAALVGRAGEAGVAGDGLAIAPVAREDLVDQHVRRFDTNAKDAGNQANHPVRAFLLLSRSHRELAQAFLFDRADLVAHDA